MTSPVQLLAIIVSAALLALVLELVRRRALTEEYSFLWIACAGALLVFSIWRRLLDVSAHWLGVEYPPSVLILLLIVFVFTSALFFSVVISRQRAQLNRLIEDAAILSARLRDLETRPDGGNPRQGGPGR